MILNLLLYLLSGMSFLCFIRIIFGPTMADRMAAIDIFGILVVGICVIIAMQTGRLFLLDVAIAWVLMSFIGTLTLAKYLTGKKLDE